MPSSSLSSVRDSSLFVVFGPSKSGTTWVQKMLDAHPDVRCIFQPGVLRLRHVDKITARAVTRATESPFGGVFPSRAAEDKHITERAFLDGIQFLRPDYPREFAIRHGIALDDNLVTLHRRMVRGAIEAFLQDADPKPITGFKGHVDVDFLVDLFPDIQIIFVVRDGRDVCVSMRHHRRRQGLFYQGDERGAVLGAVNTFALGRRFTRWLTARHPALRDRLFRDLEAGPLFSRESLKKAAGDWAAVAEYIIRSMQRYPENHIVVRYEDLLSDPREQASRMLSFIGAGTGHELVRSIVEETSMSRLKKRSEAGFFRKGVAGDWRQSFTQADVDLFKRVAGPQLTALGYEVDDNWGLADR